MLFGMNDIPARTDLGLTTPTLRSQAANDIRSSASGSIRALGWVMAACCLGFAAVNIAFQITGRFASGPYAELAAGLAVMDWIVVGLKLLGAAVAVLAANTRAATAARTVLIWGAFALLGLYSAGNIVELVSMLPPMPARSNRGRWPIWRSSWPERSDTACSPCPTRAAPTPSGATHCSGSSARRSYSAHCWWPHPRH